MSACCLCSNFVSGAPNDFWNKPLLESRNFAVVPSLGSLVEGWVLVVPKAHFICVGALPPELFQEMQHVQRAAAVTLRRQYGELCAFEHGPHAAELRVGCGVDHAHLHLLPLDFDLAIAASRLMPPGARWEAADASACRSAFREGLDYLYVEQPLGRGRIAVHADFGSQVLRRAIAKHLGTPEKFDWRSHPQTQVVARTIERWAASPAP